MPPLLAEAPSAPSLFPELGWLFGLHYGLRYLLTPEQPGQRYASHEGVCAWMLCHDGPWWVPAPAASGKAHLFAIMTATPPPAAFCVHCGAPADRSIGVAEVTVVGTPLLWQAGHCARCYDADPRCPETCTFL